MNGRKKEKIGERILRGVISVVIATVLAVFVFIVINY